MGLAREKKHNPKIRLFHEIHNFINTSQCPRMEKSAGNCLRNGLTNLVIIVVQSAAFCARLESIRFGSWTVNATSRQFGRFVNFGVFWNKGGSFQTNTLASVLGTMHKLLTSHSETNCWNLRTLPLCFLIMQRNLKVSLTFFYVMNKITEKVDIFLLIWTREQINAFNLIACVLKKTI